MAEMVNNEARRAVLREWDAWAPKHPDDAKIKGGMMFFVYYLQRERPDLLEFKSSEKWQDVHGWLRWGLRVKE
jgi:hypothetical protein